MIYETRSNSWAIFVVNAVELRDFVIKVCLRYNHKFTPGLKFGLRSSLFSHQFRDPVWFHFRFYTKL
jgi:hypothetical protein